MTIRKTEGKPRLTMEGRCGDTSEMAVEFPILEAVGSHQKSRKDQEMIGGQRRSLKAKLWMMQRENFNMRGSNWRKRHNIFFGAILQFLATYAYAYRGDPIDNLWNFVQMAFCLVCVGLPLFCVALVLILNYIGRERRRALEVDIERRNMLISSQEAEETVERLKMQITEKRNRIAFKRKCKDENS